MITKNMVETYFGEIGYSTEKSFPGIKILFHATKTGVKAVVIADAFVAGIYKKSDIRCLKKETKSTSRQDTHQNIFLSSLEIKYRHAD